MNPREFPLQWPKGRARTARPGSGSFQTTLPRAVENCRSSLRRFGEDTDRPVAGVVFSSNVGGISGKAPSDAGVAFYFTWGGAPACIAVDRYSKVEHNVQAIHHILEAKRTMFRHGGLSIVEASFKGFQALPAPESERPWWEVLGLTLPTDPTAIQRAFRIRSKEAHPDTAGGSEAAMQALNAARAQGLAETRT